MSSEGEYEHIRLIHVEDKPRTKVWEVVTAKFYDTIGEVRWYAPWRQYCFLPEEDTVFSRGCLRDIIDFINKEMNKRRRPR